jgi:hypothetical protein
MMVYQGLGLFDLMMVLDGANRKKTPSAPPTARPSGAGVFIS